MVSWSRPREASYPSLFVEKAVRSTEKVQQCQDTGQSGILSTLRQAHSLRPVSPFLRDGIVYPVTGGKFLLLVPQGDTLMHACRYLLLAAAFLMTTAVI